MKGKGLLYGQRETDQHGETQFAMLSNATVGGMPLNRLGENRRQKIAAGEEEAKNIGIQIFGVLGHTTYAVAMAVEMIVENIVNDLSIVLPVSVLIEGFCGVQDVCLSLPCVVADYGISERLEPELNQDENCLLYTSPSPRDLSTSRMPSSA